MKVLAVSDKPHRALYDYFDRERWRDIDLVLSCGDIDSEYLSFLVTMIPVPLLFVPGNHYQGYEKKPPEGCDSIDGTVIQKKGAVIAGLGGSYWYNGKDLQYTEKQMAARVRRVGRRIRKYPRLDIFVTHAPPEGIHDAEDQCHRGFRAFRAFMSEFRPRVLVHGHNHEVFRKEDRDLMVDGVRVINAYEYYRFEIGL